MPLSEEQTGATDDTPDSSDTETQVDVFLNEHQIINISLESDVSNFTMSPDGERQLTEILLRELKEHNLTLEPKSRIVLILMSHCVFDCEGVAYIEYTCEVLIKCLNGKNIRIGCTIVIPTSSLVSTLDPHENNV